MEQRRLRLGDTLDDYCPRERRVTNHAIVAMIEEDIKQTRCTTCDAEHAYKGARVPRRRKKETPAALFKEVLAGMPDPDATPVLTVPVTVAAVHDGENAPESPEHPDDTAAAGQLAETALAEPRAGNLQMAGEDEDHEEEQATDEAPEPQASGSEDWPMHRPLIRAQLPRIEGQKEERRPTEFTIRQPGGRTNFRGNGGARFRGHGGGQGNGNANGNGNSVRGHSSQRFAGGGRPGGGGRGPGGGPGRGSTGRGGPSAGFRGGPQRQGGGKKRSR